MEEFKINEDFAKAYNEYRQKEEYQKLKSRYGDVKVLNKKAKRGSGEEEGSGSDSESDSSSSSSSSSDSEWEEQEHEDFLRLYDALCRADPALNDAQKVWFRQKAKREERERKEKQVLLKDHARDMLLAEGEEDGAPLSEKDRKKAVDEKALKESFLAETEKLFEDDEEIFTRKDPVEKPKKPKAPPVDTSHFTFELPDEDDDFLRDYLVNRRWKAAEKKNATGSATPKTPVSTEKSEADTLVDQLLSKKLPRNIVGADEPLLTAADELEADDEFLVKARRFEDAWNNNDEEIEKQYPKTAATRFRFEEDDKEFIKSYPRKIESTLRQPSSKGLTRAEKRKARAERKAAEKAAKMADIARLKRLKMAEFAEKLERIRKTCGDGLALEAALALKPNANADTEGKEPVLNEIAEEMIDCLDNDWDPEAHDRLVAKLFNDDYYGAETADDGLDEAPNIEMDEDEEKFFAHLDTGDYDDYVPRQHSHGDGGDDDGKPGSTEINQHKDKGDGSTALERAAKELSSSLAPRRRGGRRAHTRSLLRSALEREKPLFDPRRHSNFERYFEDFYQLDCEDIINGAGPGDDVHCRFKYRQVKPNDFGLTVEEILNADEKELNRWVSVKTMSAYRTEEEEERDLWKYHSKKMLRKKTTIIPSLVKGAETAKAAENGGGEKSAEDQEKQLSKKALKRLRKKQRKAEFFNSMVAAAGGDASKIDAANIEKVEEAMDSEKKDKENKHHKKSSEPEEAETNAVLEVVKPQKKKRQKEVPTGEAVEQLVNKKRKREEEENGDEKKRGEENGEHPPPKKKHHHHHGKKPKLSDERLRAAGIDPMQFKYIKSARKV